MSTINKKPFIASVLESLSDAELSTLSTLMNGGGDQTELLRIWGYAQGNRTPITAADKGIHLCSLQVESTTYRGYLLFSNSYCVLIHFTDFQTLSMFEVDLENNLLKTVSEYLDINELRTEVFKLSFEEGGGAGDSDDLFKVIQGSLTSVSINKTLLTIRPYIFDGIETLQSVELEDVENGIGANALNGCENLQTLKLGVINGPIGANAFAGLENVSFFEISPDSNITELGSNCFAGIGMERNSADRFVFDFRNSTFTDFQGFGTPGTPGSYDSGTGEMVGGTPGIGLFNADIFLPATVVSFAGYVGGGGSGSGGSSGSGGVLNSSENVDLYLSGTNVIQLQSADLIPTDAQSHIYVSYQVFGDYYIATNWSALTNLFGYASAGDIASGQVLPTYDSEGYTLVWYSDKTMENVITTSNGKEMFCAHNGERQFTRILLDFAYDGTVQIEDGDGNYYNSGDLIPVGTEITITAVPDNPGDPLATFEINGVDYSNTGTAILTTSSSNVSILITYNYYMLPDYLTVQYNSYVQYVGSDCFAIACNDSSMLPANLMLHNKYVDRSSNETYICRAIGYGFVNSPTLQSLVIENGYISTTDGGEVGFQYCASLTSVSLPNTFAVIKHHTFAHTGIGDDFFANLPSNVSGIHTCAFQGCLNLNEVVIPSTVTDIGLGIFEGCSNITKLTTPIPSAYSQYTSTYSFLNYFSVYTDISAFPSGLTEVVITAPCLEIPNYCFANLQNLTSITLPNTLETIYECAFNNTGITSIVIPPSVTYIGQEVLNACDYLTTITTPMCTPSNRSNFYDFFGASHLDVPSNLNVIISSPCTLIPEYAFQACSIVSITLPNTITQIRDRAFEETLLSSITIPSSVQLIGIGAFNLCTNLANVIFENTTDDMLIYEDAFLACALTSVTLPDKVVSIGDRAFGDNYNLTYIKFGSGLRVLGSVVFSECTALSTCEYNNTMLNWNTVSKANDWKANSLITSVVCTDGTITL